MFECHQKSPKQRERCSSFYSPSLAGSLCVMGVKTAQLCQSTAGLLSTASSAQLPAPCWMSQSGDAFIPQVLPGLAKVVAMVIPPRKHMYLCRAMLTLRINC